MVSASSNLKTMINGFLVYVKQRARKMKNKRTEDILSGQSVRQCDIQTFHSVDDESSRSAEVSSQELNTVISVLANGCYGTSTFQNNAVDLSVHGDAFHQVERLTYDSDVFGLVCHISTDWVENILNRMRLNTSLTTNVVPRRQHLRLGGGTQ